MIPAFYNDWDDPDGAGQAVLEVMNFLSAQGIIRYQVPVLTESKVITDTELVSVRTSESGVFEPLVKAGEEVRVGQPLANIIHPYESELIETLYAPVDKRFFYSMLFCAEFYMIFRNYQNPIDFIPTLMLYLYSCLTF